MTNYKEPKLNLVRMLKTRGMSKYEFSKRLGVPTSNSARYFHKDYNPTWRKLKEWARVLNCKISELIDE